jgi:class 3 adenylate cyclase
MVRAALNRHRGREVKTTGDGFLATFDGTGRALRCPGEILAAAKDIGLELRARVHTGEVEVRGRRHRRPSSDHRQAVCDRAGPGQVLVSESVRINVVGAGIELNDRGEHQLKGVPGTWSLFSLEG